MRRTRTTVLLAVLAALAMAVAGCGGGSTEESDAGQPAAGATDAFPVTIDHKLGRTVIPAEPKRIVALSFEEDTLGAIGITPIAYGGNDYKPGGQFPWLAGKIDLSQSTELKDVFTALNLEQVAALQPDLILATNFYGLDKYYGELSRIAPTVGYAQEAGLSTWQDVSRTIGKAVGRTAQTEQAIAGTESTVKGVADRLPGLRGKTFTSSYYYAEGQPFAVIDDPSTISVALYQQLGMVLSPKLAGVVEDRSLSPEQIGTLDADFVFVGFETPELRTALDANPLFAGLPAVREGRVARADAFTASTINNPSLLNIPWQLEQLQPTLQKVAG